MEFKNHLISKEKARVLQQEFIKTRGNVISKILEKEKRIKGEDCRDFWVSIDILKEFIFNIEKQAREEGSCKGLGVRIFLGAYPENEEVKDAGYCTVFLMKGYEDDNRRENYEKSLTDDTELILNYNVGGRPPRDI